MMRRRDFCKTTLLTGAAAAAPAVAYGLATDFKDTRAVTFSGQPTQIPAQAIKNFSSHLRGHLLTASDPQYDRARRIWNGMIDRRPALIVLCSGAADVARSIAFARERELLVAVRGGGHSYPGYSTCNGGLVIDLSRMRAVVADPTSSIGSAEGGAWIGDLDWETQQYGLATPMGRVSNTGIGGLTLGGGYGRLSRLFGLACDNVLSFDLITAEARFLRVSATENPDLFWALRGGGGNFGVVTNFEYRLHPVGPQVIAGTLTYAPSQMREVLEAYRDLAAQAPRELAIDLAMNPNAAGERIPYLLFCFFGDEKNAQRILQPLRVRTRPLKDSVRPGSYVDLQKGHDGPVFSPYAEYAKTAYVRDLSEALVDALTEERGGPHLALSLAGGAISDISPSGTAVAHRREKFIMEIDAEWADRSKDHQQIADVHAVWNRLTPFISGFYANLTNADPDAIHDNFGLNLVRLRDVKRRYDPENFFRRNANIQPA